MSDKYNLIAFLSCLVAIVTLVLAGAYASAQGQSTEALGIGGAVTGLIGVIGTFKPRSMSPENQDVTVTNSRNQPVPVDGESSSEREV